MPSSVRWLVDDAPRLVGVLGVHREPDLAEPVHVRRKTRCGTSDETTDGMPCASSSPRTMLASTSDCVRKMTHQIGHDMASAILDLQQDHRHVVVLRRVADERGDLAQHALAQLLGRQVRVLFERAAEPRLAEAVVGAFIASLMPSVKNR